ncbi:MAG: hypothetical protein QM775_10610 [Pirellulales bacterium]
MHFEKGTSLEYHDVFLQEDRTRLMRRDVQRDEINYQMPNAPPATEPVFLPPPNTETPPPALQDAPPPTAPPVPLPPAPPTAIPPAAPEAGFAPPPAATN